MAVDAGEPVATADDPIALEDTCNGRSTFTFDGIDTAAGEKDEAAVRFRIGRGLETGSLISIGSLVPYRTSTQFFSTVDAANDTSSQFVCPAEETERRGKESEVEHRGGGGVAYRIIKWNGAIEPAAGRSNYVIHEPFNEYIFYQYVRHGVHEERGNVAALKECNGQILKG